MTEQNIGAKAATILKRLIRKYLARSNPAWKKGEFSSIARVETGLRGEVGEDFVVEMLHVAGYADAQKQEGRSSRLEKKRRV